MKNKVFNSCVFCFMMLGLFSCNNDIRTVKKAPSIMASEGSFLGSDVKTNEDFVNAIAGIQGHVLWKSFKPKGYDSNVVCVQADIDKPTTTNHALVFQFLLNKETGLVQMKTDENTGEK